MAKRLFDGVASLLGLLLLAPVLLALALWIKLDSPGPVFFRQERVGLRGRPFSIHKFRTMRVAGGSPGLQLTAGADPRITRAGAFLRRYKLDELPQLIDVLTGRMSLVGPRPEVPKYIAFYPEDARAKVLSVRPGMTDWASIRFKNESALLGCATDVEQAYIREVLPIKRRFYLEYVDNRTFVGDLRILWATLVEVFKDA